MENAFSAVSAVLPYGDRVPNPATVLAAAAACLVLGGGCGTAPRTSGAAAAPPPSPTRSSVPPSVPPSGPSSSPPSSTAPPSFDPVAAGPWHVVALGDSVTAGARCGCTPFPVLYARALSRARGARVTVQNLGQGGQDSAGLLAQLRQPGSLQRTAVRRADIVLLTIGANDFGNHHDDVVTDRCALDGAASCVRGEMAELRGNMAALLATIRALRGSRPTAVLVTGYWNVFEDGAVARRAWSAAGLRASRRLTFLADAVLHDAAVRAHATFVGLYAPFHGPAARGDVTHLLARDGNHPDAAGQALIAQRLLAAGLRGLVAG